MEELLQRLQNMHGLSAEQAHGILGTITSFIKEKFPMIGGAVDNMFPSAGAAGATNSNTAQATTDDTAIKDGGSFMDKISDYIPGGAGEKIEDFAKDKLGGFFGNK